MGEMRNVYDILTWEHEEMRPLQRSRCRWENNIKLYLREIGYGLNSCGWGNVQSVFVKVVMNLPVL
jgi:hypothetical protein